MFFKIEGSWIWATAAVAALTATRAVEKTRILMVLAVMYGCMVEEISKRYGEENTV